MTSLKPSYLNIFVLVCPVLDMVHALVQTFLDCSSVGTDTYPKPLLRNLSLQIPKIIKQISFYLQLGMCTHTRQIQVLHQIGTHHMEQITVSETKQTENQREKSV